MRPRLFGNRSSSRLCWPVLPSPVPSSPCRHLSPHRTTAHKRSQVFADHGHRAVRSEVGGHQTCSRGLDGGRAAGRRRARPWGRPGRCGPAGQGRAGGARRGGRPGRSPWSRRCAARGSSRPPPWPGVRHKASRRSGTSRCGMTLEYQDPGPRTTQSASPIASTAWGQAWASSGSRATESTSPAVVAHLDLAADGDDLVRVVARPPDLGGDVERASAPSGAPGRGRRAVRPPSRARRRGRAAGPRA